MDSEKALQRFQDLLNSGNREAVQKRGAELLKRISHPDERGRHAPEQERLLNDIWTSIIRRFDGRDRDEVIGAIADESTLPRRLDGEVLHNIIDVAEAFFRNHAKQRMYDHWAVARDLYEAVESVRDFPGIERMVETSGVGGQQIETATHRLEFCLYFGLTDAVRAWHDQTGTVPLHCYNAAIIGHDDTINVEPLTYLIENSASDESLTLEFHEVLQLLLRHDYDDENKLDRARQAIETFYKNGLTANTTGEGGPALTVPIALEGLFDAGSRDNNMTLIEKVSAERLLFEVTDELLDDSLTKQTAREAYELMAEKDEVGPVSKRVARALLRAGYQPRPDQLTALLNRDNDAFVQAIKQNTTERQRTYADIEARQEPGK